MQVQVALYFPPDDVQRPRFFPYFTLSGTTQDLVVIKVLISFGGERNYDLRHMFNRRRVQGVILLL